jgi:hypothetical protein
MKPKKIIQSLIIVVVAFVAGIMVGITLTSPGMSLMEVAGTIGRVDQYRNVRITEADIELRNELLSDDGKREAYLQYLTFEYANNIQMADNISYALLAADASPVFRTANAKTLSRIEDYGVFLDNVRLNILEAVAIISELSDNEKVAVRTALTNAGNAISQTITRSNAVYDYLSGVEDFFTTTSQEDFPQLVNAHDRLFANLIAINLVNQNRPVLEYLLAKGMMDEDSELAVLDMAGLKMQIANDAEVLKTGFTDQENLQAFLGNMEQLQGIWITDKQHLQDAVRDGQTLGLHDLETLNFWDREALGTGFTID